MKDNPDNSTAFTSNEKSVVGLITLSAGLIPFLLSAVNVALPAIEESTNANAVLLGWVATSFLLGTASFLLPAARISDLFGRKKLFLFGNAILTVTCALAYFVDSAPELIALRALQGVGASFTLTTGMAILTAAIHKSRRGRALGLTAAAVYIGLSAGPFVGGIMTQRLGWKSIFLLSACAAAVILFVIPAKLKQEWADARGESFDWVGAFLYVVGVGGLGVGGALFESPAGKILATVSLLLLVLFVFLQSRLKQPLFHVRLFSGNRTFTLSSLAALVNYAATFGVSFLLSLYLQNLRGFSPRQAGAFLIVQPVCQAVFSPSAGKLSDRHEPGIIASVGMAVCAAGLGLLALASADSSYPYFVFCLILLGVGFALFSAPNMNAIMSSVEPRFYVAASGTVAIVRLIGQLLSMALITFLLSKIVGNVKLSPESNTDYLVAQQLAFGIFCGICILGIFLSLSRGRVHR